MEGNNWGTGVYILGQAPPPPGSGENNASWVRASAGYFDTIGTKLIQGREFTDSDTSATRPIAVVNRTFAKKFFKDGNAIGQHFRLDLKTAVNYEIVGVTEDTQYWQPDSHIRPMFFLPAQQWAKYEDPDMGTFEQVSHTKLNAIELHTSGYVPGLEAQVRRVISQVNPNLTVIDFQPFAEQVQGNFNQSGMIVQLTSLFGLLALALASIGLYGVTAYSVERRTSEIGIRMALGADRAAVLKLVLRGAFLQVIIGLAIGIPATILGGRAMANFLYGIKPYDPVVLVITTLVLLSAAFIAAVVPARRAANTEPMHALRTE
jgi:predicted permease